MTTNVWSSNLSLRVISLNVYSFTSIHQNVNALKTAWGTGLSSSIYLITSWLQFMSFRTLPVNHFSSDLMTQLSSSKMSRHKVRRTFSFLHLHCITLMKHSWINLSLPFLFKNFPQNNLFANKFRSFLEESRRHFRVRFTFIFSFEHNFYSLSDSVSLQNELKQKFTFLGFEESFNRTFPGCFFKPT